jgi:hypothetical protein
MVIETQGEVGVVVSIQSTLTSLLSYWTCSKLASKPHASQRQTKVQLVLSRSLDDKHEIEQTQRNGFPNSTH